MPTTMRIISTPQQQANVANAQMSTGPKTAEGKEAVKGNATTHGLTSKRLALSDEERAQLDQLIAALSEKYQPAGAYETTLVNQAAEFQWRLNRCFAVEQALIERTVADIQAVDPALSADEAQAVMFSDNQRSNGLRLFMRYRSQIDRGWRAAIAHLEAAIAERRKQAAEAAAVQPQPTDNKSDIRNGFVSHIPAPVSAPAALIPAGNCPAPTTSGTPTSTTREN